MVDAMLEEYQNDVWYIVPKPKSKSVVSSKWIYMIKHVADGRKNLWLKDSLKEREFIMKRHLPQEARYTSIRSIMALSSMMKWDLHQMDVKIILP